jgi:hypothetical protein
MMDSVTDKGESDAPHGAEDFRHFERLIAEHPAYQEYVDCDVLRRSIADVFIPNLQELLASLEQASSNADLAFELNRPGFGDCSFL